MSDPEKQLRDLFAEVVSKYNRERKTVIMKRNFFYEGEGRDDLYRKLDQQVLKYERRFDEIVEQLTDDDQ